MKKILLVMMIGGVAALSSCNNKTATEETTATTTVDANATEITYTLTADSSSFAIWKGVMLGVKEHTGKVFFKEGSLTTKGGQLSAGTFTVDLGTIVPLDANYDEKSGYGKSKLVGHLQSPDFFDVPNFSTATFVVNTVEGNTAKGTLTVRGKSNEETLTNISITETEGALKASGQLKFDRQKYDVKYPGPAKDMVISNDIELNIELTAKK
jgi:polyisoprenoid-binding protein YceI